MLEELGDGGTSLDVIASKRRPGVFNGSVQVEAPRVVELKDESCEEAAGPRDSNRRP